MVVGYTTLSAESALGKDSERLCGQQRHILQSDEMIGMRCFELLDSLKRTGHHLPVGIVAKYIERARTEMQGALSCGDDGYMAAFTSQCNAAQQST